MQLGEQFPLINGQNIYLISLTLVGYLFYQNNTKMSIYGGNRE